MEPALHLIRMEVYARIEGGGRRENNIYTGEARMSQQQQDAYKSIIGDGNAKVQVGRDLSEKDFGNGGGVFVNVTLTCDQSQDGINRATQLAYDLANGAAWYYHGQVRQDLVSRGLLKP